MTREYLYECETEGVVVRVAPQFLEDESTPEDNKFVWAYTVEIENHGDRTLQLLSRFWRITDRNGRVQEVRGRGVVGQEPVIAPGESFQYTSGTPLSAPSGMMEGVYDLTDDTGVQLTADIPPFSLDSPYDEGALH
ncbi:MAG: Co2+/Mg2+ efflux protein ApaG [Pseudomonadota bacterium]